MKGGLHTENKPKIFEADEDHLIIDWDVSSYYPAIIINNGRYPAHLGKEFLRGYKAMFEKRLELKPLAKKDKKIRGIVGALKLAVNSVYGKSSDMKANVQHTEKLEEILINIITMNSKRDSVFWKDKILKDYYLSPEEALDLGVIDTIIQPKNTRG
jgi:hypothetical protein